MGVDLVDITAKRAALTPNRIAFEDALTGRTLTYAQLEDRCARAAAVLASLGVTREDRVAILCRNRIEFFEIMFACAKLGAILVPLNWRSPAAELAPLMQDCTPKLLVYGARGGGNGAGAWRRRSTHWRLTTTTKRCLRTLRRCKPIGAGRAMRLGS